MNASKSEIKAVFDQQWPDHTIEIEQLADKHIRIRNTPTNADLRPGNTVSGPFMMTLVDTALYVAVLNQIGIVPMAVTTNLNINFLRRPQADKDLIAECNLLKVGRKLIVGEVSLYSSGDAERIAHATGTYAVPPRKA